MTPCPGRTLIVTGVFCGVVAVSEPAFWAGYDRSSASSFADYFRHLLDVEPKRAARYGIDGMAAFRSARASVAARDQIHCKG